MRASVRMGRNFSPARNVRSITAPSRGAAQLRAHERPALAGLDVLELDDLEDGPLDLDVVPVLELVGADHVTPRLAAARAPTLSRPVRAFDLPHLRPAGLLRELGVPELRHRAGVRVARAGAGGGWPTAALRERGCSPSCNWLAPAPGALCACCVLTRTRPADDDPDGLGGFATAEAAKRRLLFELGELGLPIGEDLRFDLLSSRDAPVMTGHADGLITLDLAESDDAHRERMREEMGEPYRTVLGHLRHEVGHYYWPVLAPDEPDPGARPRAVRRRARGLPGARWTATTRRAPRPTGASAS